MLLQVTMTEKVANPASKEPYKMAVVNTNHVVTAMPHKVVPLNLDEDSWWCTKLVLNSMPSSAMYVLEPVEYFARRELPPYLAIADYRPEYYREKTSK